MLCSRHDSRSHHLNALDRRLLGESRATSAHLTSELRLPSAEPGSDIHLRIVLPDEPLTSQPSALSLLRPGMQKQPLDSREHSRERDQRARVEGESVPREVSRSHQKDPDKKHHGYPD
jgi:hypothetical protein